MKMLNGEDEAALFFVFEVPDYKFAMLVQSSMWVAILNRFL